MDIAIGIAGLLLGILIPVISYYRRKYILRPELTIEIIRGDSLSIPRGLSHKNEVDHDGFINSMTAIRVFELTWCFTIRITNNSDLTAYYPTIDFNPNGPRFKLIDKLNTFQPIKPAECIELKAQYNKYEEKTGSERTNVGKEIPPEFDNLGLLLGYQNSNKSKFHTLFDFNGPHNTFLKKKPKEYQN